VRKDILCLILILAFSGSAFAAREQSTSKLLEPQAVLKFADVPIPAGFKPLTKDSYSFESSGVRVGMLKYQGKANVDLVVNFYKEQMAMYNWNLLNVVEYNERLMNFDRPTESCIINILPKGSTVIITITIGPKSQQIQTIKAERPVK